MNDVPDYIEAYFAHQLDEAGMRQFELRCEQDELFAQDVALYITTREAIRQALLEKKKQEWRTISQERKMVAEPAPVRKMAVRRWLPYAAAACLLLFVSLYFFNDTQSLNRQVAGYVNDELAAISPTMSASADDMELGKSALLKKDYNGALQFFNKAAQADKNNDDAVLYAGIASRELKDYDNAIKYFDDVAGRKLTVNRGLYNKALTLLQRNQKGDKEAAKLVLHEVTARSLSGSKEAQELLDGMK